MKDNSLAAKYAAIDKLNRKLFQLFNKREGLKNKLKKVEKEIVAVQERVTVAKNTIS